jgi:sulfide:quinone oxidoreductase
VGVGAQRIPLGVYDHGMSKVLILGAGTAGTMLANKLVKALPPTASITVVDKDDDHDYQPGYLFISLGTSTPERVRKSRKAQLSPKVELVMDQIVSVDPEARKVTLKGRTLDYDWLIIATGTTPRPDMTEGLTDERIWRKSAFDFYTMEGSTALGKALESFEGGRLLVHITEMPIKCPVAPLEFAFLAEDYFRHRRMRHLVDITYVTPLDGAFTKPVASKRLGGLLKDRSIRLATDFAIERVDPEKKTLVGFDGRELPFDLLVTVPTNMGAQYVIDSGLGDDLGFVPVDKKTLASTKHERIFAVGDASNIPTSKAGSVAHFSVDIFAENFAQAYAGKPMTHAFDGHANCFIESGRGKAMLLDFNYDTEPLTGVFPVAGVGPLSLLKESHLNHWGKLAFEQIYWQLLLPGRSLPVPTLMSIAGKVPAEKTKES